MIKKTSLENVAIHTLRGVNSRMQLRGQLRKVQVPHFGKGVSGSEDRGGGDNTIYPIH